MDNPGEIARVSRIEIPSQFTTWIQDLRNANLIASEYNSLLRYITERETALEKIEPRHAGFVMMISMVALSMGSTCAMPDEIAQAMFNIAEGFLMMATPAIAKEGANQ